MEGSQMSFDFLSSIQVLFSMFLKVFRISVKKDIIFSYLTKNRHENELHYPCRYAAPCFITIVKSCDDLISHFQQFYTRTFDHSCIH